MGQWRHSVMLLGIEYSVMMMERKWLHAILLAHHILICNITFANGATVCASRTGMIPNDVSAAQKNAKILASVINSGKTVKINKTYYIGESSDSGNLSYSRKTKDNK